MSRESVYLSVWAKKIKSIEFLGGKCHRCGSDNPMTLTFHHKDPSQKTDGIQSIITARSQISSKWSSLKEELKKCILLCRNCHVELHHPETNPLKQKLLDLKGVSVCERCGYKSNTLASLEFHHLDRSKKDFQISNKYGYKNRHFTIVLEDLLLEMDKCIVLCGNCHMLEHSKVEKFNANKERIFLMSKKYIERMSWNREKIKKLYENYCHYDDIASALGCSFDTVTREIRRMQKEGFLVKRKRKASRKFKRRRVRSNETK